MSTLKTNSIQPTTPGSEDYFLARAWINFNGTGVVAIRGAGNVSSLTDVTTGTYTIGYTSALIDTNYAAAGSSQRTTDSGATAATCMFASLATTSVGMFTRTDSDALVDSFTSCANIHR